MAMNRSSPAHRLPELICYNRIIMPSEAYICVDVETAGPIPGDFSLLSIGACTVFAPESTFYIELKPINENLTPESVEVHKLSLPQLMQEGIEPKAALQRFEQWIMNATTAGKQPVFVAFNAPFDWMFINYYFIHFLGRNPFGHAALDIKALFMGQAGVPWAQTSWRYIEPGFTEKPQLTHHALQDALDQAVLFKKILRDMKTKTTSPGEEHP
jgi:DNA polymerase III epsilon subunit-like protein